MFRHLKCHPQGDHCALLKLHTDFFGLSKVKLLKYKMIKFNKMLIVQRTLYKPAWLQYRKAPLRIQKKIYYCFIYWNIYSGAEIMYF
jgi:hypothetical protein